jgi:hypothetical protein
MVIRTDTGGVFHYKQSDEDFKFAITRRPATDRIEDQRSPSTFSTTEDTEDTEKD